MNVSVISHPIVAHSMHHLRSQSTQTAQFRQYCHLVTTPVILAATEALPLHETSVQTPLELTPSKTIAKMPIWVPILRAGLGMLRVAQDLFPESKVGHIGLERDELTAEARTYYQKLPNMNDNPVVVLDPMLATGGSAIHALDYIKERSTPSSITLACIVAAPEGIQAINQNHPDVRIVTAEVDRELNDVKYILPGLGDFGDRYFHA
ncbi:MAG: uracil phosphoribosyltransferase [Puniceicoccaceae bacterium]